VKQSRKAAIGLVLCTIVLGTLVLGFGVRENTASTLEHVFVLGSALMGLVLGLYGVALNARGE
jgi:hypothetical protein